MTDRLADGLVAQLGVRRPVHCPEIRLQLIDPSSPLRAAIERFGLREVHEHFAGLHAPPYWAFAWAAGQALARFLLDRPAGVSGRRVLDVGTGSGVAAIAAALAGAASVAAIDLDPRAVAAARANADANGVQLELRAVDALMLDLEAFDLVIAADVAYHCARVFERLLEWAGAGREVLVADPGRGYVAVERVAEVARFDFRTEPEIESHDNPVRIYRAGGRQRRSGRSGRLSDPAAR